MIIKKEQAYINKIENPRGGEGNMIGHEYMRNVPIKSKLAGFNIMHLEPGAWVGFHQHVGNEELYCILSGTGVMRDNDREEPIAQGDVIFTGDGDWHGIKNTGSENLVFAAFIVGV